MLSVFPTPFPPPIRHVVFLLLHSHSKVRSLPVVFPIQHLASTQSLPFPCRPRLDYHPHYSGHRRRRRRLISSYARLRSIMESDDSNPPPADSGASGGGAVGTVDYVHVDGDGGDSSCFDEASLVGSQWRSEDNDDFLSRSGIGGDAEEASLVGSPLRGEENDYSSSRSVGGGGGGDDEGRVRLPEELSNRVLKLTCESAAEGGLCDVYLVGTAHVSTESCEEVQAVISILKPQAVFLELCSSRANILQPQNLKIPTVGEMVDMWKKNHNLFAILYGWFLAKVAGQLAVLPGAEFRVAFEEAMKYGGRVILGDRPVQITLRRTWAKMPLWHKTKLIASLLFQAVSLPSPEDISRMLKEMDDVDMLTLVIQEMSKKFPTLMETLVDERDKYMSSTLLRVASGHTSVVAVVGKGHVPGIRKYWNQPIEVKELLDIPSPKPAASAGKIFTTIGAVVAGAAIVSGIYLSVRK